MIYKTHLGTFTEASVGVVGLSTAIKVQEKGAYSVTILAEAFPTDSKSIKYTSCWAVGSIYALTASVLLTTTQGAHHVSTPAADARQQSQYSSTFSRFLERA